MDILKVADLVLCHSSECKKFLGKTKEKTDTASNTYCFIERSTQQIRRMLTEKQWK